MALRYLRDFFAVVLILLLASASVVADESVQEWVPKALVFPAEAELLSDHQIGATVRMFSISTTEDPERLLSQWEENLAEGGYAVERGQEDLQETTLEFSGPGIVNAKISAAPGSGEDHTVMEFDATLE